MATITVIIPSFNKEMYIAEALDSVFMQKTSHCYHIVVADDCSTDNTVKIVKQYQERHPDKITILTSDKNQKLYRNVIRAYQVTKTDYFCVLDPDDYWIDQYKIQNALDFLESHKGYTIYATDTDILDKDGQVSHFVYTKRIIDSTFSDFLAHKANFGCTLGSVYRNVIFKNGIPENMIHLASDTYEQSFRGDTFRNAIHLEHGKCHHVPTVDGIYRVTVTGLWQGMPQISREIFVANMYKDLWLYFNKRYTELLVIACSMFRNVKKNPELFKHLSNVSGDAKLRSIISRMSEMEALSALKEARPPSRIKKIMRKIKSLFR